MKQSLKTFLPKINDIVPFRDFRTKCSNDEKDIKIGTPFLKGKSVKAEVLEQKKNKKIIVFKKKRRKNYRKKNGHRQNITVLKILKIGSKSVEKNKK